MDALGLRAIEVIVLNINTFQQNCPAFIARSALLAGNEGDHRERSCSGQICRSDKSCVGCHGVLMSFGSMEPIFSNAVLFQLGRHLDLQYKFELYSYAFGSIVV